MPGILPMKVIKVGTTSQSRIAQACDRCRSKKIRCDGVRPCCSQCANVGFECRTSDKLSRRAFPRGYTESLEERVRSLETEVKELKDLLDEKDEKIDMLARMHDYRAPVGCAPKALTPPAEPGASPDSISKGDVFRVQEVPTLLQDDGADSYLMGSSSGRAFLGAFKRKIQESGKPCSVDLNPDTLLQTEMQPPPIADMPLDAVRVPPRLFTDRCVNVFFQEWAPLFPVLHKPTFLPTYEEFGAEGHGIKSNYKVAQLYLVFGIAALSNQQPDLEHIAACESQWRRAVNAIITESTLETLQCLVLAIIYCSVRKDYRQLQYYKSIAVGLSHRLGLHQSQKGYAFGALTTETRKKVFWTLYTLDCFSSASMGLPMLLKDDDIHVEYPSDTDDEYVTEKGFQPTLPGESTRLSNALALFKISRILSRVLVKLYPGNTSHEISLQQMATLDGELSKWNESLPSHLRLNFAKDKPSTDITGSRSPLLSLAYNYIRVLIHRPAIDSSLGSKSASALIAMGESSKHIVQIAELLEERNLSFSFCLPKVDMLVLSGVTFLYQSLDLKQDSKLLKDGERIVNSSVNMLQKSKAPGSRQLKEVASLLFASRKQNNQNKRASKSPKRSAENATPGLVSPQRPVSANTADHDLAVYTGDPLSENDLLSQHSRARRMTMPNSQMTHSDLHRTTTSPATSNNGERSYSSRPDHRFSFNGIQQRVMRLSKRKTKPELDFFPLEGDMQPGPQATSPAQNRNISSHPMAQVPGAYSTSFHPKDAGSLVPGSRPTSLSEWEALVGAMDNGQIYDAIYGGPSQTHTARETTNETLEDFTEWPLDAWDLTGFNVSGHLQQDTPAARQSVPSLSDESLSSGDDLGNSGELYFMGNEDFSNTLPRPTSQQQQHVAATHSQQHQQPQRTSIDSNGMGLMLDGLELNLGLYE